MAYPTRLQVKTRFLQRLDDPSASVYTDAVFQEAFGEAIDVLYNAFLNQQVPRVELLTTLVVPPYTYSLTPAQMQINSFGDFIYLSERLYGSNDRYTNLQPVDRLSQRDPCDRLLEFNWRNNTFYFIGATTTRELQVKYDTSIIAPTDDADSIGVDSSLTFLSNYAVGVAGGQKGDDAIANRCMALAVGPRFNDGVIGGELWRLTAPLVRSRQNVQVARKPFSATRRMWQGWPVPYVQAQNGSTGGGSQNVPIEYTTANGGMTPNPDGVTTVFFVPIGISGATLFWNGVEQTEGTDYSRLNNRFTFLAAVPQTGDIVTANIFAVHS